MADGALRKGSLDPCAKGQYFKGTYPSEKGDKLKRDGELSVN